MTTKVQPLRNEFPPPNPVRPWVQPANTIKYKVKTGDTWVTLGARNNNEFGEHLLIYINFKLTPLDFRWTDQVNWYLREYVGCLHSHDGGRNWAFTNDADPGYIFLPDIPYKLDPHVITGRRGTGGVSAPQYSDQNAYDTISKALDIYGMVDTGIGVLGIPVPLLVQAGFIVLGALAATVGPAIAVGAPHNDALRKTSRDFFFDGFCRTLVMAADSWSANTVQQFYPPLQYPPLNSVYKEKRESFRLLYNAGLKAGLLQAKRMNAADVRNLFVLLQSKLKPDEAQEYNGHPQDWPTQKRKNYYDRLASILRHIILAKNLQVKFR